MRAQALRYDRQRATEIAVNVTQTGGSNHPDLVCEYKEDAKILQHGALGHHPEM
jgi:hypothetical protein